MHIMHIHALRVCKGFINATIASEFYRKLVGYPNVKMVPLIARISHQFQSESGPLHFFH